MFVKMRKNLLVFCLVLFLILRVCDSKKEKSARNNVNKEGKTPKKSPVGLPFSKHGLPNANIQVKSKSLQNSGKTHDNILTSQKKKTLGNSKKQIHNAKVSKSTLATSKPPKADKRWKTTQKSPFLSKPSSSPNAKPVKSKPLKNSGKTHDKIPTSQKNTTLGNSKKQIHNAKVSKSTLATSKPPKADKRWKTTQKSPFLSKPSSSPNAKPVKSKPLKNSGKTHDRIPTSQKNTTLGNSKKQIYNPKVSKSTLATSKPPKADKRWKTTQKSPFLSKPSSSPNAKPVKSKPLKNSGKTHDRIPTSQKNTTLGNAPQGPPKPSYTQGTFRGNPPYPQQTYYPGHAPPAYPGHYPPSNTGRKVINNNWIGYPSYHYQRSDTGSTSLGFYLGYTLGRVRNPTYYYSHNSYDGYRPRYDHYTVHHYYHNNNETIIGRERIIEPNTVVECVGDGGSICPANTRSLCTDQGVIMCVASISATVPCKDEKDTNCVTSTIPCVNSEDPRCKGNPQKFTTVSIPCISTAKINGTANNVNNTIIVKSFHANHDNYEKHPNSTTSAPKTEKPQNYCVTILAVPGERQPSKGEIFFDQIENFVEQFMVKVFSL